MVKPLNTERIEKIISVAQRRLRSANWPSRETQARYAETLLAIHDREIESAAARSWHTRRDRLEIIENLGVSHFVASSN